MEMGISIYIYYRWFVSDWYCVIRLCCNVSVFGVMV